ncbi:hypothetical protein HPB52_010336 [Rhipicephalus sanguineus]|uniref:Tick transposon n=1 Tax=Rhipicephalus sanguineus TaxID=34632 RepID=A0A9D4SNC6_RHISA|nr:hypothetical protein HPB52_010336 [Rhipicephalus sanguineus]
MRGDLVPHSGGTHIRSVAYFPAVVTGFDAIPERVYDVRGAPVSYVVPAGRARCHRQNLHNMSGLPKAPSSDDIDALISGTSRPNGDRVAATQSNIESVGRRQGPSVRHATGPDVCRDLRQWLEFWDHYSATIHENTELPPIEKFKYLLTYLTGAAKRAIEGIRLADNNYEIAELLVNEHIDQLLALSPVRSSKEVEKLRVLHDTVRFRVSALEGLGVPPEQYTVVLHRVLMRCLPEDLAIMYRQKKEESTRGTNASTEPTPPEARTHKATDILAFLKSQVEVRCDCCDGIPTAANSVLAYCATAELTTSQHVRPTWPSKRKEPGAERRNHVAKFCRVSRNLTCNKCPTPTPNDPLRIVTRCRTDRFSRTTEQLVTVWNYFPDSKPRLQLRLGNPDDISIVIGSDAYWKVATGSIDRLNEELTAVETEQARLTRLQRLVPSSRRLVSSATNRLVAPRHDWY